MFYNLIRRACGTRPWPLSTASATAGLRSLAVILTAAVVLTACAPAPPELAGSRQRMMNAKDRYESCAQQYQRMPSACNGALAAYHSEAAHYRAEIDGRCGGNDRCATASPPR